MSKAAENLGIAPALCLLVGDTPYDGEAAARAGAPFIGLATGVHTEVALVQLARSRSTPALELSWNSWIVSCVDRRVDGRHPD